MQIELNKNEVEIIEQALKTWAEAPKRDSMGMSMFAALLIKDEEAAKKTTERVFADAEAKSKLREQQVLMLRNRISQQIAKLSEHEVVG